MEKSRFNLALLIPLLATVIIATFGGGLGVTFMLLDHYGPEIDGSPVLVIVLGMSLVVGVPTVAAILERRVGGE